MNSYELKAEGMAWLRFVGKKFCVATEVGPYNADILGIDEKSSVEIETKVSRADLRADFDKRKHSGYAVAGGQRLPFEMRNSAPNRFYFLVPEELGAYAVELVEAQAPKYGVLTLDPDGWAQHGRRLKILRSAKKLHGRKPTASIIRACTMRMSSELATLRYLAAGIVDRRVGQTPDMFEARLAASEAAIAEFLKGEVAWDPEPLESSPFTEDELKILANLPPED